MSTSVVRHALTVDDPRIELCPTTGCWLWTGVITHAGYGAVSVQGKTRRAHRAFWMYRHGHIPSTVYLDHWCRVRSCVNPDHLRPVSPRENALFNSQSPVARNVTKNGCQQCGGAYSVRASGERYCRPCRAIRMTARWQRIKASPELLAAHRDKARVQWHRRRAASKLHSEEQNNVI